MTVKQLIARLKKMPQNLDIGVSSGDNSEHEISDWVQSVILWDKDEIKCPDYEDDADRACYDGNPARCVVIRC